MKVIQFLPSFTPLFFLIFTKESHGTIAIDLLGNWNETSGYSQLLQLTLMTGSVFPQSVCMQNILYLLD